MRIGELSRELETGKGAGRGKGKELPAHGKFKADALRSAGISLSAAHRAEQIADQAPPKEKAAPRADGLVVATRTAELRLRVRLLGRLTHAQLLADLPDVAP